MVGCGGIAQSLAGSVGGTDDATLAACSDVVAENARELAEEYGAGNWDTDHGTMLSAVDLDAVIVATPNGAHADVVVDCAEAGVDVLCQKPLEITVEALDRMIAACEENDVTLGGLYNLRFRNGSRETRHIVESGAVGDVVLANGTVPVHRDADYYTDSWHGDADLDGGCLLSQGVHLVDRLAQINDGIERVFADVDTVAHDIEVADIATVTVRYGNGARGTITVTTATRRYPHYDRVDLHGEQGYAVSTAGEVLSSDGTGAPEFDPPPKEGFDFQVEDMADAVRSGRDPVVTGREARHACDAILAMHESAGRDAPVRVDEFLEDTRQGRR
jgi:predicted dehydrogenase